ncbi:MAG: carbon-nitrogen hydrolase family protein [Aquificae bacterium]|nr:carbon-nitrogen hydrolase family protein [Aquificota bacterium]
MGTFLSALQMEVLKGDPEANLKKVERLSSLLPKGGLLLLPEVFCCGFDYGRLQELASQSAAVLEFLKDLSGKLDGVVVATLPLKEGNCVYNAAVVFDKGRLLGRRPKIKLFPLFKEPLHFCPGREEENRVFETSVGKVGIVVCFEVRFNSLTNALRRQGAQIILVPALWGLERREHFKVLTRARAIETQSFLVAANGWGKGGDRTFFAGSSGIYSPWGEVLAYKEDGEGPLVAEVDLSQVEKVRKKLPVDL